MVEKMRDSDKSSEVFNSMQQSNEKRNDYYDTMHKEKLRTKKDVIKPIGFSASNNTNTLYYQQSMKAPDVREFKKATIKEVNAHIDRKHCELTPREQVPNG